MFFAADNRIVSYSRFVEKFDDIFKTLSNKNVATILTQ